MSEGVHPSGSTENPVQTPDDIQGWLALTNRRSLFITDCRAVSETQWADRFSESLLIEASVDESPSNEDDEDQQDPQTVAREVDQDAWMETRLAQFIGEALVELSDRQEDSDGLPDVIWLHLSGLTSAWDAPYEYRLALCDEDDPRPSFSQEPVSFQVNKTTDLDEVFQAMCAASGQAKLIDHLWSWIDAYIEQLPDRAQLAVLLAGIRGYPLGEHGCVGLRDDSCNEETNAGFRIPHSELVHVPLIVQPGFLPLGYRTGRLTQSMAIRGFVEEWLNDAEDGLTTSQIAELGLLGHNKPPIFLEDDTGEGESCWIESFPYESIYTRYWAAIFDSAKGDVTRIYLMPDDRWQQNDVLNRVAEVADAMIDLRSQWLQWKIDSRANVGATIPKPEPSDSLREPV